MAFLKFARELDALLLTLDEKPDLQSAFWHYRGYWFQQLGIRVSGILMAVIETFREQVGAATDPGRGSARRENTRRYESGAGLDAQAHIRDCIPPRWSGAGSPGASMRFSRSRSQH